MRRLPLPAGKRGTRPGSRFAALGCLHLSRHTPSGRSRHVIAGGRGRSSRGAALECAGSGRDRFRARAGPKRTTIKYVRRARTRVRGGRRCIARRGSSSRGASTRFRRALRDHHPSALRVVRISILRVCPLMTSRARWGFTIDNFSTARDRRHADPSTFILVLSSSANRRRWRRRPMTLLTSTRRRRVSAP